MEDMPFKFNVKSTIKMLILVTNCESITTELSQSSNYQLLIQTK